MATKPKLVLTPKQVEANEVLAGDATHILGVGGSRSGKTFLFMRSIIMRALKAPGSRHGVFRYRFNSVKESVVLDTWPKVLGLAFPGTKVELNKSDWVARFENGSEIWFGGLDDKDRAEKVLGKEFVTIFLNEVSQIPLQSRELAVTRLAQQVMQGGYKGSPVRLLKPRMYYDCNPPSKAHWSYKIFIEKRDPETRQLLPKPDDFAWFRINPIDNEQNVASGYIDTLRGQSGRLQKRFLLGEFADATPNQLFDDAGFETYRVLDGKLPDMVRIVVAVDPSGSGDLDNADNDAIGIAVVGLGTDGNCYLLEDCTVKAGPATWGRVAVSAYERHAADMIVGEANYGGAMVEATIQTAKREIGGSRAPYKSVTATRGKVVRAEPIAALYEQGKVRHVGYYPDLEDELVAFSTIGYVGDRSPNRADALIWALTELFPGVVSGRSVSKPLRYPSLGLPGYR